MDLSQLAELKQKLLQGKQFSEILDYFMTHFGERPEFIALGNRTRDTFLEAILSQVSEQLFKKEVSLRTVLLTRLPEHEFIHGGGTLQGRLISIIYFTDVRVGLLAVVSYLPGQTQYVRFTGRPMETN